MRSHGVAPWLAIAWLAVANVHASTPAVPTGPDGSCPLDVPFRRVEDCRGFSDTRGPDPRFFQVATGRPDPARCREIRQGRVPEDLAERGWRPARRRVPCGVFGLPPGRTCLEMERRFDVRQVRVEGYDRSCSSGVALYASDGSWIDECLEGRFLRPEERHRLHLYLRLVDLDERPDAVVLDRSSWSGPAGPVCLHLGAGDLVVPTLRIDLDLGDRIRVAPAAGRRVRVEGPIQP